MDTILTILGLAVLFIAVIWVFRRIGRFVQSADSPEEALQQAREEGLKYSWDEISVERLDGKRSFRNHVERLSRPDIPFKEVAQLAQSATPGLAALGLSAIARRDDVPERWTDDAIRKPEAGHRGHLPRVRRGRRAPRRPHAAVETVSSPSTQA